MGKGLPKGIHESRDLKALDEGAFGECPFGRCPSSTDELEGVDNNKKGVQAEIASF